jgi:hypothetical protein
MMVQTSGTLKRIIMTKTLLTVTAAALLFSGCSKLSKENYDKIQSGMQYDEVVQLIGKPDNCSEAIGLSTCEWSSGDATVTINFIANKVTISSSSGLK